MKELLKNFLRMVILIHFIGCVWAIMGSLFIAEERHNWLRSTTKLENKSPVDRYITSCYWAVVTMCTVGYGEISPQNEAEVFTNILVIWFGVSFQSYIMSRVTMVFNSTKPLDYQISRQKQIEGFCNKNLVDEKTIHEIKHFFRTSKHDLLQMYRDYNINQLMSILPIHLKAETVFYIYKDAINTIKIL